MILPDDFQQLRRVLHAFPPEEPLQCRVQPGHQHQLALRLASKQPSVTRFAGHVGIGEWSCLDLAKLRE